AGAHEIRIGDLYLDLLLESRRADTTLVVFHGALSSSHTVLPDFHGRGAASAAGVNLISLSDPSLQMGDVDVGWFIGDRTTGRLPRLFTPVITHALRSLGGSQTMLMGGSGGGYAALSYAANFSGATVLLLNPRLNLSTSPFAKVDQYLRV